MNWPAEEVRILEHYLAAQPAGEDRIEVALARLTAIYVNAHLKEGVQAKSERDFLPYLDPWKESDLGDVDEEVLRALLK